jgi:hypothetical protein
MPTVFMADESGEVKHTLALGIDAVAGIMFLPPTVVVLCQQLSFRTCVLTVSVFVAVQADPIVGWWSLFSHGRCPIGLMSYPLFDLGLM